MEIAHFYDPATFTLTYVVFDPVSRDAVAIDPVLDYDPAASSTSTTSVDRVAAFVEREGLHLHHVLETHAHADHLSGSQVLRARFGARVAISERITEVQRAFEPIFNLGPTFATDGSQFDLLVTDHERLAAGTLEIVALATPGHTPACMSFLIDGAVFTGDALFIEDYGTGRCDFPGGSADALYVSVHERLYALPDATLVFVGHDYCPGGRPLRFETTIGRSKEANIQLRAETSREHFVEMRRERDATLAAPRLLYPSVQINIDAGRLPAPRANGRRYLTIPLASSRPEPPAVRDIAVDALSARTARTRVIDVRDPAELTGPLGHIRDVESVPLAELPQRCSAWSPDDEIVLVCRSGKRSATAAQLLVGRGFRNVSNLSGGMVAHVAAGLPVER